MYHTIDNNSLCSCLQIHRFTNVVSYTSIVLRQATSCASFFELSNICLGVSGVRVNCDAADIPFRSSESSVTFVSFYSRSCGSSSEAESCSCIVEWFAWVDRQLCGNLKFRYCRFSVSYQRMPIATRMSPKRLIGKNTFHLPIRCRNVTPISIGC